jgi:hypothetical protein
VPPILILRLKINCTYIEGNVTRKMQTRTALVKVKLWKYENTIYLKKYVYNNKSNNSIQWVFINAQS